MLPGETVGELPDGIRPHARANLPLQVVDAVSAVWTVDADRGRSVLLGQARDQRQSHLAGDVVIGIVGAAEDLALEKGVPAETDLIDERRTEGVGIGSVRVLTGAEVVTLVVTPYGDLGFVGIVEDVVGRNDVALVECVIHAARIVALPRSGAVWRDLIIQRADLGVGLGHELEKNGALRTEAVGGDDVAGEG